MTVATGSSSGGGMMWLVFALLVVVFWGCYGVAMHKASVSMKPPKNSGISDPHFRYKAYIFVGVAYVGVAIIAPLIILATSSGASWSFPSKGIWFSLLAGTLGAFGAFFVLSAMGAVSSPRMIPAVMCVVFGGAPIVNAVVALLIHPPEKGWGSINPLFWLGIVIAVVGVSMVTAFKPSDSSSPPAKPSPQVEAAAAPTASALVEDSSTGADDTDTLNGDAS